MITCKVTSMPCECGTLERCRSASPFPPTLRRNPRTAVGGPDHRETRSTNPKKALGMTKPPMHLVPAAAIVGMAMAFKDGAAKYGPFNWRIDPVDATTYIAAAKRHIDLWFNGQDNASDSGVHNLDGAMACLAILQDARAQGNLIDDRPPAQDLEALMDRFTVGKGLPA
jgi:hypothetical protein